VAAHIDGTEEVLDRLLAEPLALGEGIIALRIAAREREDVGGCADQSLVMEKLDPLATESFDIEGKARDEVLQALLRLGRTDEAARAAADGLGLTAFLALVAHGMTAADRTGLRKLEGLGVDWPSVEHHAHDLRDDVAGPLNNHGIADANVLAPDFVLVVQR